MRQPVKLALVGIDHPHGADWRAALRNLGNEVEIVALAPCFQGATASLEERYAGLPRFASVEELAAGGDFEAAVVCLPNSESADAVARLAAAGKHVLVEKPGAADAAAARRMAEAVRSAGVAFQNGYMWRYDAGVERLKQMVVDGRFGKLIGIQIRYFTSDVSRRGPSHYLFDPAASHGGFFNWLACHWMDLLLHLTGEQVVAVTGKVGVFGTTPCEVEDGGAAIFELAGGTLVSLMGGYWLPRWAGESGFSLFGSQRWVHWDPGRPGTSGVLEIHGPQPQWHAMEETFVIPPDPTPGYGGRRGEALLRDWLRSIREGGSCRNTPESTVAALALVDAVYESSSAGKRVECRIP